MELGTWHVERIGEVPEWLNGTVSKTVVVLVATVGSNPTLSAERKVSPEPTGSRSVEKRMGKYRILRFGVIFTPEIAQFQLGDLTF